MIDTLNLKNSMLYTLSIRLSADGFCFSVYSPHQKEALTYSHYRVEANISLTANLKQALAVNEYLKFPFKRVNILFTNTGYTLIPFDVFDEEQAETLYYYNLPKLHNESVYYNILHRSNVVTLFGIDKSTLSLIHEQYPDAHIYTNISPIIEFLAEKSRNSNSRALYVYLQQKQMHYLAFECGKLLFANTFSNPGKNDCIYYTLNLWKQVGLNQQNDHLWLIGSVNEKDELLPELGKYIEHIGILPPIEQFCSEGSLAKENEFPFDMQALLLTHL